MRAHRTDLVSFAFGLLFVALAAWWLLAQVLGLILPPVGWFLAGGMILIGGLGLVGALRSGRLATGPETTASEPGPAATVPETTEPETTATAPETTGFPPGAATDREPHPSPGSDVGRTLDLPFGRETPPPDQRGPAA